MTTSTRQEIEVFWQRWLEDNRSCEKNRDWKPLAEYYAPDATYGWNCGPNDDFMAVGRDEIRDIALGQEMQGLEGWTYPYQVTMIDEKAGMVIGFWKQVADARREDGSSFEVAGLGASWFGYEDGLFTWQRDFFDHGNAASLFFEMMAQGVLPAGLAARIEQAAKGKALPGHYQRKNVPVSMWPPVTS